MSRQNADIHEILREHAENIIRKSPGKMTPKDLGSIKDIIHELNVHRIELEMQNDELKKIRSELEEEKSRYQHLFDFAPVGYIITNEKGLILDINQTAANLFGENRLSMRDTQLSHCCKEVENKDTLYIHLRKTLKSHSIQRCELTLTKIDQSNFEASILSLALKEPGSVKPIIRSVITDVSEVSKLKAQLQHALKMEAIGTLTGGVAHDFNNILSIILGNAELAINDVPDWNPAKKNLEEILKASFRARDIVKQLLVFSRKSNETLQPLAIAPIIEECAKMLRAAIPTSIALEVSTDATGPMVEADPTQIHQILMNLCTNAYQAMPDGKGTITILHQRFFAKTKLSCFNTDLPAGEYVMIAVTDDGIGIARDKLTKIFDPYFTTKETGEGTGLGLATVYGIVNHHHGGISVQSTQGIGSTIEIFFRPTDKKPEIKAEPIINDIRGQGKILFVDDEPAIAALSRQMLNRLGYQVVAQTSSHEALKHFFKNPDSFDLVISDMAMPELTGDTLAQKILEIRPDIPIILCTGHSDHIDKERADQIGIRAYMEKPFIYQDLAKTVKMLIGGKV